MTIALQETLAKRWCFSCCPFEAISEHFIFMKCLPELMNGWTVEETAEWERDANCGTQKEMQRQRQTLKSCLFFTALFNF